MSSHVELKQQQRHSAGWSKRCWLQTLMQWNAIKMNTATVNLARTCWSSLRFQLASLTYICRETAFPSCRVVLGCNSWCDPALIVVQHNGTLCYALPDRSCHKSDYSSIRFSIHPRNYPSPHMVAMNRKLLYLFSPNARLFVSLTPGTGD